VKEIRRGIDGRYICICPNCCLAVGTNRYPIGVTMTCGRCEYSQEVNSCYVKYEGEKHLSVQTPMGPPSGYGFNLGEN
jgi:hypothetical protein